MSISFALLPLRVCSWNGYSTAIVTNATQRPRVR